MNLFDIVVLLVIVTFALQFWRVRAISEKANDYLRQYCEKNGLQLISVARRKTRLAARGKLDWHTEFNFEFSSNGEDSYQGSMTMIGLSIVSTDLPVHRIN